MADIFIKRTDGKSNRAAAEIPIHYVLDSLRDLSLRLQHHDGDGLDLLERYDFFIRNSNKGRTCTYAHKCQQLLLLSDLPDIKQHLLKVIEYIRSLPGEEDFAK